MLLSIGSSQARVIWVSPAVAENPVGAVSGAPTEKLRRQFVNWLISELFMQRSFTTHPTIIRVTVSPPLNCAGISYRGVPIGRTVFQDVEPMNMRCHQRSLAFSVRAQTRVAFLVLESYCIEGEVTKLLTASSSNSTSTAGSEAGPPPAALTARMRKV